MSQKKGVSFDSNTILINHPTPTVDTTEGDENSQRKRSRTISGSTEVPPALIGGSSLVPDPQRRSYFDDADIVDDVDLDWTNGMDCATPRSGNVLAGSGLTNGSSRESSIVIVEHPLLISINVHDQGLRGTCYAYTIADAVRSIQRFHGEPLETTVELVHWITGGSCFGNPVHGGNFEKYFKSFVDIYKHWTMHKLPPFSEVPIRNGIFQLGKTTFKRAFSQHCEDVGNSNDDHNVHIISFWLTEVEWDEFRKFHSYDLPALTELEQRLDAMTKKIHFSSDDIKLLMHIHLHSVELGETMPTVVSRVRSIVSTYNPNDLALPEHSTILHKQEFPFQNIEYNPYCGCYVDSQRQEMVRVGGHGCVVHRATKHYLTIKNSWGENWGFIGGLFRVSYGWLNELYKRGRVSMCSLHGNKHIKRARHIAHTSGKIPRTSHMN